jgi:hypothetical protein
MKLSTKVTLTCNTKEWEKMKRRLERANKDVEVGWWNTMHPSGVPVASIVQWQEEGFYNGPDSAFPGAYTPPRAFVRNNFMDSIPNLVENYSTKFNMVMQGTLTKSSLYNSMKKDLEDLLKKTMLDFSDPANSRTTVEIKGFNDPLIETGTTYDSIKSRLVPSTK